MHQLILLRHGESEWNKKDLFTGWTDVDLDEAGAAQARHAAALLRSHDLSFDLAYTSYLKRAIRTLWIVMDELGLDWAPIHKTWRLNERHYGALQGLSKSLTAEQYDEEQVKLWRRCYDVRPPALAVGDERNPANDPRYDGVTDCALPLTESLKDTFDRLWPYWTDHIVPQLLAGRTPIVVAHGNTLRALVKQLDGLSDEAVIDLNIPIGQPLEYRLDGRLRAVSHRYLDSKEAIQGGIRQVIAQGEPPAR